MLLIIKEDNKEKYEDYYEWNQKVYDIPVSIEEIKNEYISFVKEKCKEVGLEVNYYCNENISFHLSIKHYKKPISEYRTPNVIKKDKKLFDKILKENNFYDWIENTYNIKPIEFKELHIYKC